MSAILILSLSRCDSQVDRLLLADLREAAWVEEDQREISPGEEGVQSFFAGFQACSDTGRALHRRNGTIALKTISGTPRRVSLAMRIPYGGGQVRVFGQDRRKVYSEPLSAGQRTISFIVEGSPPQEGRRTLRLRWDPTIPDGRIWPALVVTGITVDPVDARVSLSTVIWDSLANRVSMGPGCSISVFLVPQKGARIRGYAEGGHGPGFITVDTDDRESSVIWVHGTHRDESDIDASLEAWEDERLIEVRFVSPLQSDTLVWREVEFSNMRAFTPGIMDESPPALPKQVGSNSQAPNVLLYLVDTVRRDHLQIYGYERETTPGIRSQIGEWTVWDSCLSLSSWTRPATASLLTGLDPVAHGANTDEESIHPDIRLIWEDLHDEGYETAFFSTNGHVSANWGFTRGIDHYAYLPARPWRHGFTVTADSLHATFMRWLDEKRDTHRPFFAYLHAMEPHAPYTPPLDLVPKYYPDGIRRLEEVSAERINDFNCPYGDYEPWHPKALMGLYDAEIAGWDRAFCLLLDSLERRHLLDATIIIVTSDHGEEFADHGAFSHGRTLYREQMEVPFLARVPGLPGGRVATPMDHRDVAGLISWLLCGKSPLQWEPRLRDARVAFLSRREHQRARVQRGDLCVIWNMTRMTSCDRMGRDLEVYVDDPLELASSLDRHKTTARAYRGALMRWWRKRLERRQLPTALDQETMHMLELLGYVTNEGS